MRNETGKLRIRFGRTLIALIFIFFTQATSIDFSSNGQEKDQQVQPPQRPDKAYSPGLLAASGEDYYIGLGDVIEIKIEKADELSGIYRVGTNGSFLMPYIGKVAAHQKTPEQLERSIADSLKGRYLTNPIVRVVVTQYNSRSLFIQGAVRKPGVYQIEGRPTLLALITLAGGLDPSHGSTAFIIRKIKSQEQSQGIDSKKPRFASAPAPDRDSDPEDEDGDKYELLKVNISGLFKGNFDQNATIEPGDIINIPPADVFFVAGEVNKPGSFPLKEGTTLRQAISLAESTTFKAATNRGVIFREDPATGKRLEIPVDIGEVMKGKKEDLPILANDIIVVPNSRLKSFTSVMLQGFGLSSFRLPVR